MLGDMSILGDLLRMQFVNGYEILRDGCEIQRKLRLNARMHTYIHICTHTRTDTHTLSFSLFVPFPLTLPMKLAVPCPAVTFASGVSSGASLSGSTTAAVTTLCADGFAVGGGASTQTSVTYTCTGTGPATSGWLPSTSATQSTCQRKWCLFFVCHIHAWMDEELDK